MSLENNSMVKTYLDTVTACIKWREVHGQVKAELLSHLEEVVLELTNDGYSEQHAVSEAIRRMGDATDLGRKLQQIHVPQKNWLLVATVALLSGLGITLMYMLETGGLFIRNLIFTGLGICLLFWLHYYDFRKVRHYAMYLYVGTMLLWLAVLFFGTSINGKQFLSLGPVNIDYSSILPYILVVSFAGIFTDREWSNRQWLLKAVSLLAVPFLIFVISDNLPLALIYSMIFLALMAIAGARKVQIVGFLMVPIISVA